MFLENEYFVVVIFFLLISKEHTANAHHKLNKLFVPDMELHSSRYSLVSTV